MLDNTLVLGTPFLEMADKRQALERARLLNPKADRVRSLLFARIAFFDPLDKLQVKYEMLRCHEVDRVAPAEAAALFGYTRQGLYQVRRAFLEEGMAGLLEKKRGRRGPVKCTPEIVAFIARDKQAHPVITGHELADKVFQNFGVKIHRRTIEKLVSALPRRKKKRRFSGKR